MTEQSRSYTGRSRCRKFSEVDYSFGEHYHYRSEVPFVSFDERLQRSRQLFSNTVPTIVDNTRRFHNNEAATGYRCLSLRGFVVQGSLDPKDPSLDDVFMIIDSIGWAYTVMHVHPFCPRVVREFISNKPFNDEGALIRGHVFQFSPSVINRLMMTPSVNQSFGWRKVVLKQAISHLTGGQCSGWTRFNLNALLNPFQALYCVCELNWLPGDEEAIGRGLPIYGFADDTSGPRGHIESATTDSDRQLTIKIKRKNTSQTEINFSIRFSTTDNGHITDNTADLMVHMCSYHDIYFPISGEIIEYTSDKFASMIPTMTDYAGTHVRTVIFNPKATNMIDLDVALIDLRASIREPIPEDSDKVCSICQDKFIGKGDVN
ncbi:hypothetical protein DY000_02061313 [Brassica cretica]|uniref:Uncharacterized protein n=1 Tax=Brassica cretica TaxID=69181 RepID=A0ABQ7AQW6_BRACR|nr:hypothetical protein DY000_02061313 [Brassica cretica]